MGKKKGLSPARTPEQRESQLINLAMKSAEELMLNGKAPSQIITHFLKLGAARAQLELDKLRADTELAQAKMDALKTQERSEEKYEEALNAFRSYGGYDEDGYYDD